AAVLALVEAAAARLANAEEDEEPGQNSRYPEGEEHRTPSEAEGDRPGHLRAEPRADRRPEGDHRECHGAARCRKVIRQDGVGTGCAAGLSDTDADPRPEELPVTAREPGGGRQQGPRDEADSDDVATAAAVDQPRERKAERDIEEGQRRAGEERDVRIREMELAPDGLEHRGYRVAIGDAERVDEAHDDGDVPALPERRAPDALHRLARRHRRARAGLQVAHAAGLPAPADPTDIRRMNPNSAALCEIARCRLTARLRPAQISNTGSCCAVSSRRHNVTFR